MAVSHGGKGSTEVSGGDFLDIKERTKNGSVQETYGACGTVESD